MLNKISLIGRVGKDPEIKHLESGAVVAKFSLATSEKYKDKTGETKEQTEWHNVVIWNKLVEVVEKWVKKGDLIYLSGKVTYRSYDKDGETRYFTEINCQELKMLGGNKSENSQPHQQSELTQYQSSKPETQEIPFAEHPDDLPF